MVASMVRWSFYVQKQYKFSFCSSTYFIF
jgi:hypothetical protein